MSTHNKIALSKMEGAGNSFLILPASVTPKTRRAHWARRLCDTHFGIGSDGLLYLEDLQGAETKWDFYNSDGSEAEFCGNAARCVAQYVFEKTQGAQKEIQLTTQAGQVHCRVISSGLVQVQMPQPQWMDKNLNVPLWPQKVLWINTGVPHVVLEVPHIDELKKFKAEAAKIRSWSGLGEKGSNVTFVFVHSPEVVSAVSFERGVEDFTLACGTGAVAAALYTMEKFSKKVCDVQMPGGTLTITHENGQVSMQGEARRIAEIQLEKDHVL